MQTLEKSLAAWGSDAFAQVFKKEMQQLPHERLPLQQGLTHSSHVLEKPVSVILLNHSADENSIDIKAGVFYAGVVAGCSCADDPTPLDEVAEYCEVRVRIDRSSASFTVTLLPDRE